MSEGLDRRLAAVMFTDMVGYTALMQADERLAVDRRDRYVTALNRYHDALGGTVVQRLGDGSMSMFPSSLAAVLAVAIQQELVAKDVPVRIGIHVGEVIIEPERLTGEAVNIAARIESFAVPGGVMLSDAAYDQIKNRSDVEVVPLGRFRLKNVGRPFELYAVSADGVVVPDPVVLEGKGERFASLPSNLPDRRRLDPVAVGRDDVPRRPLGRRLRERLLVGRDVLVVALVDVEVGLAELPALLRDRAIRSRNRLPCSSRETLRKTLTIVVPSSVSMRSNSLMCCGRRLQTSFGARSSIRTVTTSS